LATVRPCHTGRVAALRSLTDGVVTIRSPLPGDAELLVAGRDEEFHRWLGAGDPSPRPTACIVVDDEIVGWVDYETGLPWLLPGEVNVGYSVFSPHRGNGYATRAVKLLLGHLAAAGEYHTAALVIAPDNVRSLAVAERAGFVADADVDGRRCFKRLVSGA
jgi:RimJ/RimL family protein N-acetyltransferase